MARYPEDGALYEGTLLNVERDDEGRAYGTVRFVGYDNEQVRREGLPSR